LAKSDSINTVTHALQRIASPYIRRSICGHFPGIFEQFSKRGQMLKIKRSSNGQVVFTVSGQMDEGDIGEMEVLLRSEKSDRRIVLDLKDLTLAGRDVIRFLVRCEADGITLENCAVYVREWITRERRDINQIHLPR
jgi:hypothetical protein